MKSRLIAGLGALALALGLGLVAPSSAGAQVIGPDVQTWSDNAVENSGFSTISLLVSGTELYGVPSRWKDVAPPRYTSRSTGYYLPGSNGPIWNPEAFAVAPNAKVLYRVTTPWNGGAFPWQGVQGGPNGTFVSAGNLFRFFGCTPGVDPCTIQVIQTY